MSTPKPSFYASSFRVSRTLLLLGTISFYPAVFAQEGETSQVEKIAPSSETSAVEESEEPSDAALQGLSDDSSVLTDSQPEILQVPPVTPIQTAATLPHNLSPWGMFMAADWVVKTVMIGLAIASLLTWTVLVSKSIELKALRRKLENNAREIGTARSLADVSSSEKITGVTSEFVNAAEAELHLSVDVSQKEGGKDGIKERVISNLSRIEAASSRRMLVGTGLLATIGAIGPFVGLLGTVWGIMNSFIGISQANTTNLAVVAPGIAEALLATALGLIAAIPAVVIYNHFSRKIAGTKALVADSAAAVMRLVSRDLDRGVSLGLVKSRAES